MSSIVIGGSGTRSFFKNTQENNKKKTKLIKHNKKTVKKQ